MKRKAALTALVVCLAGVAAVGQPTSWQQQMEEDRRSAASGEITTLVIRPGTKLAAKWPAGVYVFYNNPRPFCYAYTVPGQWYPLPGGTLRSKDGGSMASVTFRPPSALQNAVGPSMLEQARNVALQQIERDLHQSVAGAELVPFKSPRQGTWQLKASPLVARDGRSVPFPLYILVDLSPHTFAEVNVMGTGDDENMARRIIGDLRTTSDSECYFADLEWMYKASQEERQ